MVKKINIESINTIIEAIKYHNQILSCDENVVIDFKNANFIRNNFISIIGMGIERAKQKGKEVSINYSKNEDVNNALKDIGFFSKFLNEKQGNDKFGTMIPYTHIPLENNSNEIQFIYNIFISWYTYRIFS